jgi:hypothetical protein
MAREWLMILREKSYGVPDLTTGAPTAGSSCYVRLDGDNAFTARAVPMKWQIPYGGGVAKLAKSGSDAYEVKGSLKTGLYASQAGLLLGMGITPVSSDRAAPWATTDPGGVMPPGDLASVSLYHGVELAGGTIVRTAYRGCKVVKGSITNQADGERRWMLSLDFQGGQVVPDSSFGGSGATAPTTTEFPDPTEADYPADPYVFSDSGFTFDTERLFLDSLSVEWDNTLDARRFTKKYVQLIKYTGRKTALDAKLLYSAGTDRATYQAVTAKACSLVLNNGATTTTLDFQGNNVLDGVDDDLAVEKAYEQGVKIIGQVDAATGNDLVLSVA